MMLTAAELTGENTRQCRERVAGRRGRPRTWPPKLALEARALRELGIAYRTIARSLSVPRATVLVWCQSASFAP